MLYRICTENKNTDGITSIVDKYFEGFTLLSGFGFWHGILENSLTIEIYSDAFCAKNNINEIAEQIKELNSQEAVLVQEIKCKAHLV